MSFLSVLAWIIARLSEPSTWTASGVGALMIHTFFPGAIGDHAIIAAAAVASFLGVIVSEKGPVE